MSKLDEIIEQITKSITVKKEDLQDEYEKLLKEEKERHSDLPKEKQEFNAARLLRIKYRRQLSSPAKPYEGKVLMLGGVINTTARLQADAKLKYEENPSKAIEEGYTDEDGTPLDRRELFSTGTKNPGWKKPLIDRFLRNVTGACTPFDSDKKPRPFNLILNDAQTNLVIPMNTSVKFRALERTPEGETGKYELNGSSMTTFEKIDKEIPEARQIVETLFSDKKVDISKLREYHRKNFKDPRRLAIVEGDVVAIDLTPNVSTGNRRVILDDVTLPMLDKNGKPKRGITCWVPEYLTIDFAENSRIIVAGQSSEGAKYDEETRRFVPGSKGGDMMINAYGIFPIDEYLIKPEIKKIDKSSLPKEKATQPDEEKEETPSSSKPEEKVEKEEGAW